MERCYSARPAAGGPCMGRGFASNRGLRMYEAEPIVFVVDDDESVRESLRLLIEAGGWQAQTYSSAQAFLARPPALGPSCLLLDLILPDLNGCDLQSLLADKTDM